MEIQIIKDLIDKNYENIPGLINEFIENFYKSNIISDLESTIVVDLKNSNFGMNPLYEECFIFTEKFTLFNNLINGLDLLPDTSNIKNYCLGKIRKIEFFYIKDIYTESIKLYGENNKKYNVTYCIKNTLGVTYIYTKKIFF